MALLRRGKEAGSVDGTMSLMEHLYELRRRLFFAVLGLLAGTVVGFIWFSVAIPAWHIKSLGDILLAPYCHVPPPTRVTFNGDDHCALLASGPFSGLQVRLKSGFLAGAILSSPVWLLQLWGFVTPALLAKERKYTRIFVCTAAVLLAAGSVLAYVVLFRGLEVLLKFGGSVTQTALSPESYYSFLIGVMLIFGVSFLLPLLLVMLNFIGVLPGQRLRKSRRYSMFGLVVFAGLTVPGNDPITMLALAVSLCLLFEISVQVSLVHDRRKGKRLAAEGFTDLADDVASPTPNAGTAIDDDQYFNTALAADQRASAIEAPEPLPEAEYGSRALFIRDEEQPPRFDPDAT
ncbi:MAG: twin-arginine translocase subunit TatC [Actinomycetota bacterium]|nr:twin-arginine translocase subunit TatC [Actinomycetota bacterium]